MTVTFYNTLTRQKEEFTPLEPGKAGIYSCGPTVYNYVHLGNMRSYIFADTLRRVLEYAGYEVKHVMNITDVGHLVSDADEGDDKMEVGKHREGLDAWALAEKYTEAFIDHADKAGLLKPHVLCKATDHIKEQIDLVKTLEDKGLTYITDDGVYFDTAKFKSYGDMAKLDIEGLSAGARIEDTGKRNKTDFALWKFSPKDEQRDMEWDSPWGRGFPGWHAECSAMSMKYLGDQFDIHTGGMDLIPVHHTNEIAQSEGATGKGPFVRYWLHNEFLQVDEGIKMSKSDGNFLTIDTLINKGYDPLAFRYLCLTAHYRNPIKFSWASMDQAQTTYDRLCRHVLAFKTTGATDALSAPAQSYQARFADAVTDDLNTARGLAVVHDMISDDAISDAEKYTLLLQFDRVFGLALDKLSEKNTLIPDDVIHLANRREAARQNKNWDEADKLRGQIEEMGYTVEDTKDGPKLAET